MRPSKEMPAKPGDNFSGSIVKPTLVVSREKARRNIRKMCEKAERSRVFFRPHFKTHQSALVGEWFREFGINAITVSSVSMATYFAGHGWQDITIAFPVNIREIESINDLAGSIQLSLLVESVETVHFLKKNLRHKAGIWIKVDVGTHRTGIEWQNFSEFVTLAQEIQSSPKLSLKGILTHAGHTYRAGSKEEIEKIYQDTVYRMKEIQNHLMTEIDEPVAISVGDTPACSIVENLRGVDEIRPGNFVYYDVMQLEIGSCSAEEIAAAVACPVVARHPARNEIVIYGGAVHLSKEMLISKNGLKHFGMVAPGGGKEWSQFIEDTYVASVSQEHGVIKTTANIVNNIHMGDLLMILPVHSCLAADLLRDQILII